MSSSVRQFVLSFLITFAPAPLVGFAAWAIVATGAEAAAVPKPLVPKMGEPPRIPEVDPQPETPAPGAVDELTDYDPCHEPEFGTEELVPCHGRAREIESAPEPAFKGM